MTLETKNHLVFSFDDMQAELNHMRELAADYLDYDGITQLLIDLDSVRYSRNPNRQPWGIPEDRPLRTVVCPDGYEPGDRKCTFKNVYGELSSIWEIVPMLEGRPQTSPTPRHFSLVGLASTKIKLFDEQEAADPRLLAQWQFEVGDHASPGCHFHAGILQTDEADHFPKGLSVPRLPSILVTPMDGLDFLLSELTQDVWGQTSSESSYDQVEWTKLQKIRLAKLLNWKLDQLQNSTASAWWTLKKAKPVEGTLFV